PDGGPVRRVLHALRGARALAAGHPLCRRARGLHLVRLRLFHGRSLAAHADRPVVPDTESDSFRIAAEHTRRPLTRWRRDPKKGFGGLHASPRRSMTLT